MFCHCTVEAQLIRWLKGDLWKAGITITSLLLLLTLKVWLPVSTASADEKASGPTAPVMISLQATPTEDATVTALNKEKLAQEIQQLKNQNEPTFYDWLRGNISILLLGLGALAGFLRWLEDRRDAQNKELADRKAERERREKEQKRWLKDQEADRDKRAEERFKSAVTGLGDEKDEAKIGAAIVLRTFLRPGYEQFYIQTFDLTIAHLRQWRTPNPPKGTSTPLPVTRLRIALLMVFKVAFPLARSQNRGDLSSLDASRIQLDNAYLRGADLMKVWMSDASLRKADLRGAHLNEAHLSRVDLSKARLVGAHLNEAELRRADLSGADLSGADLSGAILSQANLSGATGTTPEQLARAKSLKGATMPDGSIHP
jgi:hypothetical protein